MKDNYIHMGVLIDASSSMTRLQGFIIEGFNTLINKQKEVPGEATVSLAQFSSFGEYKDIYNFKTVSDVPELTTKDYIPSGWTALNDAIGRMIIDTGKHLGAMKEADRPSGVMIYIMSDGAENHSKEFKPHEIKAMVEHQESKYSWQFVYIGANQDSKKESANYGISNSFNFSASGQSVGATFMNLSEATQMFRSAGGKDLKRYKRALRSVKDEDLAGVSVSKSDLLAATFTNQTLNNIANEQVSGVGRDTGTSV